MRPVPARRGHGRRGPRRLGAGGAAGRRRDGGVATNCSVGCVTTPSSRRRGLVGRRRRGPRRGGRRRRRGRRVPEVAEPPAGRLPRLRRRLLSRRRSRCRLVKRHADSASATGRGAAAALLVLALALGELLKEKRPRRRSTLRERRFFFLSCGHLSTSSFCSIGQPAYRPRMALLFSLWFGHALTSSQSSSGPRDESGEGWSPCYSCEAKTFASMSMRLC